MTGRGTEGSVNKLEGGQKLERRRILEEGREEGRKEEVSKGGRGSKGAERPEGGWVGVCAFLCGQAKRA